jgi:hypothetical protein
MYKPKCLRTQNPSSASKPAVTESPSCAQLYHSFCLLKKKKKKRNGPSLIQICINNTQCDFMFYQTVFACCPIMTWNWFEFEFTKPVNDTTSKWPNRRSEIRIFPSTDAWIAHRTLSNLSKVEYANFIICNILSMWCLIF